MEETAAPPPAPRGPRISRMAIVALVLAALPMCFPLNMLGAALGLAALVRIGAAPARFGGRRLAKVAIVIGLVFTISGWWLWGEVVQWSERNTRIAARDATAAFIQAAVDGHPAEALGRWSMRPPIPTVAQIEAFGRDVAALGTVEEVGVVRIEPTDDGGLMTPVLSAWLVITIDGTPHDGTARFEISPGSSPLTFMALLRRVTVKAESGEVILDPAAAGEPDS